MDNKELSLGKLLVENLSSEHFDLSQYSVADAKELERLKDSKAKGKTISRQARKSESGNKKILSALKASL